MKRFKSGINLAEYAESHGYEIDRRESSRASLVMRNGDDKIVVATDKDGHGIYFSVRNDRDNGSIIDFVQHRRRLNLGEVRKELRMWYGDPRPNSPKVERKPEAQRPRKPEPSSPDRQQALSVWLKMRPTQGRHAYLERERKISRETLSDPRFVDRIRQDDRGNAVFPHYDRAGLSGYELKNRGFTGFAKNGEKAVWHSANLTTAPRVVVVESAIDAMSHAQIIGDGEAAYISTGGSMSPHQCDLVRSALTKASERGAEIIIATDADEPGKKLADQVFELAPTGSKVFQQELTGCKDWNDLLREQERKLELQQAEAMRNKESEMDSGPQMRMRM